jgi:2-oxoglutarate ferredoxin oxidoreductase subunit alpha
VAVVELNDSGMYGYGQLATILRAAYAEPKIQSICKTDGLTFRIREIVTSVEKLMTSK